MSVRPFFRMIAHSAFIIVARRLADVSGDAATRVNVATEDVIESDHDSPGSDGDPNPAE